MKQWRKVVTIISSQIFIYVVTCISRLGKTIQHNCDKFIYNVMMEIHLNNTAAIQILWQIPPKKGFDLETISLSKTSSAFITASKNSLSMFW